MLTSGSLAALQEVLASWIAHDRSKHGHYFSSRVPKMAVYGAFVSAPLGHVLISILQRLFKNRTSLKAKILQILVSNLIVCCFGYGAHRIHANDHTWLDCTHSEYRVSDFNGPYCWCENLSSGSRDR